MIVLFSITYIIYASFGIESFKYTNQTFKIQELNEWSYNAKRIKLSWRPPEEEEATTASLLWKPARVLVWVSPQVTE